MDNTYYLFRSLYPSEDSSAGQIMRIASRLRAEQMGNFAKNFARVVCLIGLVLASAVMSWIWPDIYWLIILGNLFLFTGLLNWWRRRIDQRMPHSIDDIGSEVLPNDPTMWRHALTFHDLFVQWERYVATLNRLPQPDEASDDEHYLVKQQFKAATTTEARLKALRDKLESDGIANIHHAEMQHHVDDVRSLFAELERRGVRADPRAQGNAWR